MNQSVLTFVLLWLVSPLALAVIETYEFSSRDLEARYQQMSAELRCPKCQNQNIADSNAPIAQDLRKLLHQQLEAGASNDEIKQFMVSRYGEFVLYRPRFSGATALLWLAPVLLFICAALVVFVSLRRRDLSVADSALSDADKKRLKGLLGDTEKGS
ncbi:MAG: cytochrome c-type biogenesis protein [Halioglobus sp.]